MHTNPVPATILKAVQDALGKAIRIHTGSFAIYGVLLPMDGLRGQQGVHHQGRSLRIARRIRLHSRMLPR